MAFFEVPLIPDANGKYVPHVGGSPYNVARALGRQNIPTAYLSPFSKDSFGDLLREQITRDGVAIDANFSVARPTSIAVVALDETGAPSYSLYREGIADREYDVTDLIQRIPPTLKILHTGSLAIVPEDLAKMTQIIETLKQKQVLISIDLNVRPHVVNDHDAYAKGLRSLIPYCDILKASDEDLACLGVKDWREESQNFLNLMQGGLVAMTFGAKGAWLGNLQGYTELPANLVENVSDTIGAGDCFHAGLLSAIYSNQLFSKDQLNQCDEKVLQKILSWASACAAINVTRDGCQPPTLNEITSVVASTASHLN